LIATNGLVYSFLPVKIAELLFIDDDERKLLFGLEETEKTLS